MKQGGPKETNAPAAPIAKERGVILAESKETSCPGFPGISNQYESMQSSGAFNFNG